jgi:hypothetical protein
MKKIDGVRIPMKSPGHSEMMSPGVPTLMSPGFALDFVCADRRDSIHFIGATPARKK